MGTFHIHTLGNPYSMSMDGYDGDDPNQYIWPSIFHVLGLVLWGLSISIHLAIHIPCLWMGTMEMIQINIFGHLNFMSWVWYYGDFPYPYTNPYSMSMDGYDGDDPIYLAIYISCLGFFTMGTFHIHTLGNPYSMSMDRYDGNDPNQYIWPSKFHVLGLVLWGLSISIYLAIHIPCLWMGTMEMIQINIFGHLYFMSWVWYDGDFPYPYTWQSIFHVDGWVRLS
ncbi:hypothetical protein CDAR_118081 [Caerostris darwini]|uniref:Cytochrome c oxidase subunit 1 n=1 Tax=Caerostris darwini TaxID=1538125 RepID=A0AAV4TGV2_9ARAC|nr:hypothetical protein CDAR_118081 [Caerostris darwini]